MNQFKKGGRIKTLLELLVELRWVNTTRVTDSPSSSKEMLLFKRKIFFRISKVLKLICFFPKSVPITNFVSFNKRSGWITVIFQAEHVLPM